jgi:hypothetical protein
VNLLKNVLRWICPSHATVVAYLALFMAMGGTAYAAVQWTSADIADESLQSVDVKDNSLTGADITAGSIQSTDLAPGAITGGGASTGSTLLDADHNPQTVTGAFWASDRSTLPAAASVAFNVPDGQAYYVLVSAQAVAAQSTGRCTGDYGGGGSDGYIGVYADGDHNHNLLPPNYSNSLPGGAWGGAQPVVFGSGDHTIVLAPNATWCSAVADPGTSSLTNAFLAVNLLAAF